MLVHFVQLVHLLAVLFMVTTPFQDDISLLVLHVTSALSIFTHWVANNNICFLSLVEAKMRKIPISKGFIHSLVAPVYDMNAQQTNIFTYFVLFCLMSISLYKIFVSDRWSNAVKMFKETKQFSSFLLLLEPC